MVCLDQTQHDASNTSHQSLIFCDVQAIALCCKQMADREIRQVVDCACAQAPSQPTTSLNHVPLPRQALLADPCTCLRLGPPSLSPQRHIAINLIVL